VPRAASRPLARRPCQTLDPTMAVTSTPKLSIAVEFLERAIELHLRGNSYHSAIHLAGAAEELLNVYTREIELDRGELRAPVNVMRFDDDVMRLFGSGLVGLTDAAEFTPSSDTHGCRQLGQ